MRIGIISDIHADLLGLKTALKLLQNDHQVDEIICAGDLVGYGKQPNEVITLLRATAIPVVRGNHDVPTDEIHPENADYLNQLPADWRATYANHRLYMCHGIPVSNFIGFGPTVLEREAIQNMVRSLGVDFVIAGHTHQVFCGRLDETWILNPGAVYTLSERGTTQSYGILNLDTRQFAVYDVLRTQRHTPIFDFDLRLTPQN